MDSDAAFEKFRECAVEVLQVPADKITKDYLKNPGPLVQA